MADRREGLSPRFRTERGGARSHWRMRSPDGDVWGHPLARRNCARTAHQRTHRADISLTQHAWLKDCALQCLENNLSSQRHVSHVAALATGHSSTRSLSPTSPVFRPSSPLLSCPLSAHAGLEYETLRDPRRSGGYTKSASPTEDMSGTDPGGWPVWIFEAPRCRSGQWSATARVPSSSHEPRTAGLAFRASASPIVEPANIVFLGGLVQPYRLSFPVNHLHVSEKGNEPRLLAEPLVGMDNGNLLEPGVQVARGHADKSLRNVGAC